MNASNHSGFGGSNTKQERGDLTMGTHDYRFLDKTNIENFNHWKDDARKRYSIWHGYPGCEHEFFCGSACTGPEILNHILSDLAFERVGTEENPVVHVKIISHYFEDKGDKEKGEENSDLYLVIAVLKDYSTRCYLIRASTLEKNVVKGGGRHVAPEDLNAEHKVFPRYVYEMMDEKECPE